MRRTLPIPFLLAFCFLFISCDQDDAEQGNLEVVTVTPAHGVTGTVVTIKGKNMLREFGETIILFNDIRAEVLTVENHQITVLVPDFTSTGEITIQYHDSESMHEISAGVFDVPKPGSTDQQFNANGSGPDSAPINIQVMQNGKIVVAGFLENVNDVARTFIARLKADGTVDETFDVEQPSQGTHVRDFDVAEDGSVVMTGNFQYKDENQIPYLSNLARLLPDGSHDKTTLKGYGPVNGSIHTVALQSDGKILIGGDFTKFRHMTGGNEVVITEAPRHHIVRLNADFTLDESFDPGTGFDHSVSDIILKPNGDIMVVGSFTEYNGEPAKGMALLDDAGVMLPAFSTGEALGSGEIYKAVILPDNKWIVSGTFTAWQGHAVPGVVKLLANGNRDTEFQVDIEAVENMDVPRVVAMAVDEQGNIALGGAFKFDNGSRYNTVIIDPSGDLFIFDTGTTFRTTGSEAGAPVALAFDTEGRLLVSAFNSYTKSNIVRSNLFRLFTEE